MPFPTDTYLQFIRNGLGWVAQEFESFYAQLQGYLSAQHKEDGSHGDITGDSLTLSDAHGTGSVIADGDGTFGGDVTALAGTEATGGYDGSHVLGTPRSPRIPLQIGSVNGLLLAGANAGFLFDVRLAESPGVGPNPELQVFNLAYPSGPVLRLVYDVSNARHVISTKNFGDGLALGENASGQRIEYIAATTINLSGGTDLSHYSEGTFTPALTFGGASTGITYTSRPAAYVRVGKQVTVNFAVQLSSKGSATGTALITGLPFTTKSTVNGALAVAYYDAMSSATGMGAYAAASTTSVALVANGSGTVAVLTDANFTNSSFLVIGGTYLVD